jgi:tripartite ATP-independent transporter DctP family solute receptor
MRKSFALIVLTVLLTFGTVVANAAVTIKFAHSGSSLMDDPQNIACYHFQKILQEKSNGYYKVEIYPAKQLGDTRTILEGIQMGTIEMGDIESGPTSSFVQEEMLWDLPYLFRDLDHAHAVLQGEVGEEMKKKWQEIGVNCLDYNDGGFRYFTNSLRPIVNPKDMNGMKIRVMESPTMIASINGFGASAVPMAFAEVYSALQQKAIDGQENPLNVIYTQSYYEVQKYLSFSEHFYYLRHYLINDDFYRAQPAEMQKIILECAKEACGVQRVECAKAQTRFKKELVEEYGMTPNDVNKEPFIKLSQEKIWPQFYKELGKGDAAAGKALIAKVINTGK